MEITPIKLDIYPNSFRVKIVVKYFSFAIIKWNQKNLSIQEKKHIIHLNMQVHK